jgi:hypothetical protein
MEQLIDLFKLLISAVQKLIFQQIRSIYDEEYAKLNLEKKVTISNSEEIHPFLPSSSLKFRIDIPGDDDPELSLAVSVIETLETVHLSSSQIICGSPEYHKAVLSAKNYGFKYLFHRIVQSTADFSSPSDSSVHSYCFVSLYIAH